MRLFMSWKNFTSMERDMKTLNEEILKLFRRGYSLVEEFL